MIATLPLMSTVGSWVIKLPENSSLALRNIVTDKSGSNWFRGTASLTNSRTACHAAMRFYILSLLPITRHAATSSVRRVLHEHSTSRARSGASNSASSVRDVHVQLMTGRKCMSSRAIYGRRNCLGLWLRSGSWLTVCPERIF